MIKDRHCVGLNAFFYDLSLAQLKGPPTTHQAEVRDLPSWSYCQLYLNVRLKIGLLKIRGIRPRSGDSPRLKPLPIFTSTAVDAATQFFYKNRLPGMLDIRLTSGILPVGGFRHMQCKAIYF